MEAARARGHDAAAASFCGPGFLVITPDVRWGDGGKNGLSRISRALPLEAAGSGPSARHEAPSLRRPAAHRRRCRDAGRGGLSCGGLERLFMYTSVCGLARVSLNDGAAGRPHMDGEAWAAVMRVMACSRRRAVAG